MKKVIKSIGINEARKDMILANSIRDASGKILLIKGNRLDYPAISLLRKEGINSIYIYQFVSAQKEVPNFENSVKPLKKETAASMAKETYTEPDPETEIADNFDDVAEEKYSVPASPRQKPPL